jgi:hypothetical protein
VDVFEAEVIWGLHLGQVNVRLRGLCDARDVIAQTLPAAPGLSEV